MRMTLAWARCKKGFTLVELLMVMAIIAILASLLLVTVGRSKTQAQITVCKNHLHQTGLALSLYVSSDNQRYPPMWGRDTGIAQTWADRLSPYSTIGWTNRSWHCPAYVVRDGIIKMQVNPPDRQSFVHTSYSYNAFGMAEINKPPYLGLGFRKPLASEPEILAPSEMYVAGDARTFRDISVFGEGVVRGISGNLEMQPYGLFVEETAPLHGSGYNLLFADGHVVLVKRTDYLFPPRSARHWNRDNQPHSEVWTTQDNWCVQE